MDYKHASTCVVLPNLSKMSLECVEVQSGVEENLWKYSQG